MSDKLPATMQDWMQGAQAAVQRTASVAAAGGDLLRLLKQGFWVYGADDTEVEDGSLWAINPNSFQEGYCAWVEGALEGEEMRLITEPPVKMEDLESGLPWKKQLSVQFQCVSGEDEGQTANYKVTSVGGIRALRDIITEIMKQVTRQKPEVVPVVTLDVDSYKHKTYGKVFNPVLSIQKWVTIDGIDAKPEPEALPEPEPEPESEQPARRRRRRA